MNARIDTTQYEAAHGRKPRGTGNWFFFFDNDRDVMNAFQAYGSYTNAKKQAIVEATSRGVSIIHVGS